MRRNTTSKKLTYKILDDYLQSNKNDFIEYVSHLIIITAENTLLLYQARKDKRRKTRNIAISEMMYFLDMEMYFEGYEDYYATNKQVMQWDNEHDNILEKVLDKVEESIIETRNEE